MILLIYELLCYCRWVPAHTVVCTLTLIAAKKSSIGSSKRGVQQAPTKPVETSSENSSDSDDDEDGDEDEDSDEEEEEEKTEDEEEEESDNNRSSNRRGKVACAVVIYKSS